MSQTTLHQLIFQHNCFYIKIQTILSAASWLIWSGFSFAQPPLLCYLTARFRTGCVHSFDCFHLKVFCDFFFNNRSLKSFQTRFHCWLFGHFRDFESPKIHWEYFEQNTRNRRHYQYVQYMKQKPLKQFGLEHWSEFNSLIISIDLDGEWFLFPNVMFIIS